MDIGLFPIFCMTNNIAIAKEPLEDAVLIYTSIHFFWQKNIEFLYFSITVDIEY